MLQFVNVVKQHFVYFAHAFECDLYFERGYYFSHNLIYWGAVFCYWPIYSGLKLSLHLQRGFKLFFFLSLMSFSIFSLNTRGLKNNVKSKALFLHKIDFVLLLQRTVCFWIWLSYGTEHSARYKKLFWRIHFANLILKVSLTKNVQLPFSLQQ